MDVAEKWYEHTCKPESVSKNGHVKLLWDFYIQTGREIQVRRPDIVMIDRENKQCFIIDVAKLRNARVTCIEKKWRKT